MFPIGSSTGLLYGYPEYRIENTKDGELLVKETPSIFGPHVVRKKIIRLSKDDINKWWWLELKRDLSLFFNYIIWTIWRLVTLLSIFVIPVILVLLTWHVIDDKESAMYLIIPIIILFSGVLVGDLIHGIVNLCDLPYFKRRDHKIRKKAESVQQEILNRNGFQNVDPAQVGPKYVFMIRELEPPPQ